MFKRRLKLVCGYRRQSPSNACPKIPHYALVHRNGKCDVSCLAQLHFYWAFKMQCDRSVMSLEEWQKAGNPFLK